VLLLGIHLNTSKVRATGNSPRSYRVSSVVGLFASVRDDQLLLLKR
jgi:hypothetical protein